MAGPTARARFWLTDPSAIACGRSDAGTSSGCSVCQVGAPAAPPIPITNSSAISSHGVNAPIADSSAKPAAASSIAVRLGPGLVWSVGHPGKIFAGAAVSNPARDPTARPGQKTARNGYITITAASTSSAQATISPRTQRLPRRQPSVTRWITAT
jgi:hypothetical protein